MREIKFRAWDKKRSEWYGESSPDILTFMGFAIFGECTLLCTPPIADLINLEITQYTGLKDKNGGEIYEGDILETGSFCDGEYSVVMFNARGCFVAAHPRDSKDWCLLDDYEFEVIGNIYQHPELLETTHD